MTREVASLYDVHPEPVDTFWYWMQERELIRIRRFEEKMPGPWTEDPILRQYAFCNVFREQDRVTIWVRENIREPYADHPNLWLMLAIARTINWPPTLEALINSNVDYRGKIWPVDARFDGRAMGAFLDHLRQQTGAKLYTGAYMIRAESDRTKPWFSWTKQEYIGGIVIGKLWEARTVFDEHFWEPHPSGAAPDQPRQPTLKEIHTWLSGFHGWGPFMAYEVVTDLRHTRYLRNAPDIMTWANAGPGAIRGLKRMFPHRVMSNQADYNTAMQELLAEAPHNLPDWFPALEMRDIEHSLCEFDKYSRVKHGEGRPRAMFAPGKQEF